MKCIVRLMNGMSVTASAALFFTACHGAGVISGNDNGDEVDISLITPYVNESDMASIHEAFSSDDSAPWGYAHGGIDLFPVGNLKPFQAVCSGVIDKIELWQNNVSFNWQVNVRILCNSSYSVVYIFEPMSTDRADGESQLANILISEKQTILQGDLIGHLLTSGQGSHLDFSLSRNLDAICPEPYFTPEARDSILSLIHIVWPGANMCY